MNQPRMEKCDGACLATQLLYDARRCRLDSARFRHRGHPSRTIEVIAHRSRELADQLDRPRVQIAVHYAFLLAQMGRDPSVRKPLMNSGAATAKLLSRIKISK